MSRSICTGVSEQPSPVHSSPAWEPLCCLGAILVRCLLHVKITPIMMLAHPRGMVTSHRAVVASRSRPFLDEEVVRPWSTAAKASPATARHKAARNLLRVEISAVYSSHRILHKPWDGRNATTKIRDPVHAAGAPPHTSAHRTPF